MAEQAGAKDSEITMTETTKEDDTRRKPSDVDHLLEAQLQKQTTADEVVEDYFDNSWRVLWIISIVLIYIFTLAYMLVLFDYYYTSFDEWTPQLPDLNKTDVHASFMITHISAGLSIMFLALVQIEPHIRKMYDHKIHRIVGRIGLICSLTVSICGCSFIVVNNFQTVGGINMTIAFFSYGLYFGLTAIMTGYYVKINRNIKLHKQWALRLYFLAIASILYRVWFFTMAIFGYPEAGPNEGFEGGFVECDLDKGTCPFFLKGLSQFNAWWFFIGGELLLEFAIYSKAWSMVSEERKKIRNIILNVCAVISVIVTLLAPIWVFVRYF